MLQVFLTSISIHLLTIQCQFDLNNRYQGISLRAYCCWRYLRRLTLHLNWIASLIGLDRVLSSLSLLSPFAHPFTYRGDLGSCGKKLRSNRALDWILDALFLVGRRWMDLVLHFHIWRSRGQVQDFLIGDEWRSNLCVHIALVLR